MTLPNEDDTALDAMAAQARAFPPLPLDEVAALLPQVAGDPKGAAAEKLLAHHLFTALDAALANRERGLDVPDLYQEGTLAVLVAITEFAERGGAASALRAYVEKVVAAHIETAVQAEATARESDRAFVIAAEQYDLAEVALRRDLARQPTTAELAVALKWPESQVVIVQNMLNAARENWDEDISQYLDDEPDDDTE